MNKKYVYFSLISVLVTLPLFLRASQLPVQSPTQASRKRIHTSFDGEFLLAVQAGDLQAIQKLFAGESIPYINAKNKGGNSALMLAADAGHSDVVQYLLEAGADVDFRNLFDFTALMLAAKSGHAGIVQQLLAAGAAVNAKNFNGVTALMLAAQNSKWDVVKTLIELGADIALRNEKDDNKQAYHYASDKQAFNKALLDAHEAHQAYLARKREAKTIIASVSELIPDISDIVSAYAHGKFLTDLPKTDLPK